MKRLFPICFAILWSVIWWGLIFNAGSQLELLFYALFVMTLLAYLLLHDRSDRSLLHLSYACFAGLVIDGILMHSGLISYTSLVDTRLIPPFWILCLWLLLGMGINIYADTLGRNAVLTAVVCGLLAPACYLTGSAQAAVNINADYFVLTIGLIVIAYAAGGWLLQRTGGRHAQSA